MKVAADADRLRREGVDVVDFSAGEPDFPTPDNIKRAAIRAIEENFTKYTPVSGPVELKQAICDHHKRLYGTTYNLKECIANMGGKHAIFNLTQALLDPGDEVIIPVPYWVTFKDVVNYAGGKCVFAETSEEEGFAVFDRGELEKIFRTAKDRGIWIMADECYERFLYDSEPFSLASLPGAKDTVVVAGSLSKTYAMTGWRMGFVLAPAVVVAGINKLQSHATSNPNSITQKAAIEALNGPQDSVPAMLAEYR
jgi:aspartate aminotransferase